MTLEGKKIGFAFTGAFEYYKKTLDIIKKMVKIKDISIIPIMSFNSYIINTKYGDAKDFIKMLEEITQNKVIHTINDAERIGKNLDIIIIAPCTGNTISKLANDIADTPVIIVTKNHILENKPVVIGIASKNALSDNAENIGKLLNRKNYYFVPFRQSNPLTKPNLIIYNPTYIKETLEEALEHKQIQPIIL